MKILSCACNKISMMFFSRFDECVFLLENSGFLVGKLQFSYRETPGVMYGV